MANVIINGMQWGDEGKGKIVDLLCPSFDGVIRYQGGDNAGHTVKFGDRHFALHLVPSGILRPEMSCVLGTGMVINPESLFEELDGLAAERIEVAGRLFVSERAHVVLPLHRSIDRTREAALGKGQIGTTVRGIGPAYESKISRYGVRFCDLYSARLRDRVENLVSHFQHELRASGESIPEIADLVDICRRWGERLEAFVVDTESLVHDWLDGGRSLLFEGAQGAQLDIDHGTYPYVTSSSPIAGGASVGAGVPPNRIDGVLGVLKAYTTRVGGGPFVSELHNEAGQFLRDRGNEFGTTTGRPRRCGWLDTVVARRAQQLSGVSAIALTKLDVLDELDEIKVCVGYRIDGESIETVPASLDRLERVEPVLRTLPGWRESTVGIVDYDELPRAAREYVSIVEEEVGAPVGLVSTGPRREETIVLSSGLTSRLLAGGESEVLSDLLASD